MLTIGQRPPQRSERAALLSPLRHLSVATTGEPQPSSPIGAPTSTLTSQYRMNIHSFVTRMALNDDKREAVLQAALILFSDRGFHGVAVPEIAARAGVGAGTIYRHFESKEAIVNALYQRWKGSLSATLMGEFPFTKPARAQVEHVVDRLFDFAKKHPQALKFLEAHHHAPYLDVQSKALEARLTEPVRAFFEQHGRVTRKAQPELLFGILWGGVMGVVRASWEGYLALDHVVIRQTKEAIWDALRRSES